MAELTTLARPYAKAAFEHALKASDLKGWAQSLRTAAAVSQAANVGDLLHSPALTTEQKTQTFVELCADELNGAQQNFISVMAENHRLPLLPQVLELFELYKANHEKAIDVEILTAYEIDKAVQDKLAKVLSEKLDREVALRTAVDTSLLGGAVIRAGDTVIDGSAKGKLAKLAEAMSH